jgi:hypothetical protein
VDAEKVKREAGRCEQSDDLFPLNGLSACIKGNDKILFDFFLPRANLFWPARHQYSMQFPGTSGIVVFAARAAASVRLAKRKLPWPLFLFRPPLFPIPLCTIVLLPKPPLPYRINDALISGSHVSPLLFLNSIRREFQLFSFPSMNNHTNSGKMSASSPLLPIAVMRVTWITRFVYEHHVHCYASFAPPLGTSQIINLQESTLWRDADFRGDSSPPIAKRAINQRF